MTENQSQQPNSNNSGSSNKDNRNTRNYRNSNTKQTDGNKSSNQDSGQNTGKKKYYDPKKKRSHYSRYKRDKSNTKSSTRPGNSFKKISIVIPLFNEQDSLNHLIDQIKNTMQGYQRYYEVIFVDDGSTDNSLEVIKGICKGSNNYKYISFQQNFGKSAALHVGFKHVTGDAIITMDADLQDDPSEIPALIAKLEEGYDLVSGWKKKRYDPFIKRITSKFFNFVTGVLSGIKIHDFNCGLKAYRRIVVDNLNIYGELHRYIPVLAKWKGFRIAEIPVKHHPRKYGMTKFGLSRFYKGFVDLVTVTFLTRYTKRPMHFFGLLGALSFLAGLVVNGYLSYLWMQGQPLSSRPMLFLGMLLMIVGVQLFSTGLLGELLVHNTQTEREYSMKDSNVK